MMVPMISGCPSAKAAHARPRAVSAAASADVPCAMKPNCSSQSKATFQSLRNAEMVSARSLSSSSRLRISEATSWSSSPYCCLSARSSDSSFLRVFGFRLTRVPNSAEPPLSFDSSSDKRCAARIVSAEEPLCVAAAAAAKRAISFDSASVRRRSWSCSSVFSSTSGPYPRLRWRSTNGRSTESCEEAVGILPTSISRSSCPLARLRRPATESDGAYTTYPSTSIPRRPARPAICQNSSARRGRCPGRSPSLGLSSWEKTTVRAGMLTPTARVSVAKTSFTSFCWKHISTNSRRIGSMPEWW
mmetsp:Transcript_33785/g.79072  ORF Transcript_33785/g.79072 Transcript_33785/m.79072 type:complete len:302 (-) Transcript_33785:446-1351(-)